MNTLTAAKKQEKQLKDEQIINEVQENVQGLEILYQYGIKLKYKWDVKEAFTPNFWQNERLGKTKKTEIEMLASFGELKGGVKIENGIARATDGHIFFEINIEEKDGVYLNHNGSQFPEYFDIINKIEIETYRESKYIEIETLEKKVQYFYNCAKNNFRNQICIGSSYYDPEKLKNILFIFRNCGDDRVKLKISHRGVMTLTGDKCNAILMPQMKSEGLKYEIDINIIEKRYKLIGLINYTATQECKYLFSENWYKQHPEARAEEEKKHERKKAELLQELNNILTPSLF